jgi:hypothetical protein
VGFRGAIVGVSPHCFRDPAAACPGENMLIVNILSVAAHTTTTNDCPPRKLKAMRARGPSGSATMTTVGVVVAGGLRRHLLQMLWPTLPY